MFIIFNKQKIYSYLVALSTVVVLFIIAFAVINAPNNNVLQTSGNQVEENRIEKTENTQNQVQLNEKKEVDENTQNQIKENNPNKEKQNLQQNNTISNTVNK